MVRTGICTPAWGRKRDSWSVHGGERSSDGVHSAHTPGGAFRTHTPQSELPRMSGEMQLLHTAGVVFHLGHLSLGLQMGLIIQGK